MQGGGYWYPEDTIDAQKSVLTVDVSAPAELVVEAVNTPNEAWPCIPHVHAVSRSMLSRLGSAMHVDHQASFRREENPNVRSDEESADAGHVSEVRIRDTTSVDEDRQSTGPNRGINHTSRLRPSTGMDSGLSEVPQVHHRTSCRLAFELTRNPFEAAITAPGVYCEKLHLRGLR